MSEQLYRLKFYHFLSFLCCFFMTNNGEASVISAPTHEGGPHEKIIAHHISKEEKAQDRASEKNSTTKAGEYILGHRDAPITVIMYYSLTCGHCKEFEEKELPRIKEKFINTGKVCWIIRDFPLDNVALKAAQVAWCKGADHYLEIAQHLLTHQNTWAVADGWQDKLFNVAHQKGITREEFDHCLENQQIGDDIATRCLEAQKEYEVAFAPAFITISTATGPKGALFKDGNMTFQEVEKIVTHHDAQHAKSTPKSTT